MQLGTEYRISFPVANGLLWLHWLQVNDVQHSMPVAGSSSSFLPCCYPIIANQAGFGHLHASVGCTLVAGWFVVGLQLGGDSHTCK